MIPLTTLAIATADIQSISPSNLRNFPKEWQSTLMDEFHAQITDKGRMKFSKHKMGRDYCKWDGVDCVAGVVTHILHNRRYYGNFGVQALPSTVESITIQESKQKYAIQTRALPRRLRACNLPFNQLFGSVDLRTLPRKLIRIDLQSNELTGPIELTNLPDSLERIYLVYNRIVQSVVVYDRLPPKAKYFDLMSTRNPTNRIDKVCAIRHSASEEQKAVFRNIPKKNVR